MIYQESGFLCRRLIFTYLLIGTSQSASHTIRQHRKKQYPIRQQNYMGIVTYLPLHSSQCAPLRQMYPRFHIYASIVGLCGPSRLCPDNLLLAKQSLQLIGAMGPRKVVSFYNRTNKLHRVLSLFVFGLLTLNLFCQSYGSRTHVQPFDL